MPYTHVPFEQVIDACLAPAGEGRLTETQYGDALVRTDAALVSLREAHADHALPLLALPGARDDLRKLGPVAAHYRDGFSDVVVLGTGGSSLGGRALAALAEPGDGPRLHFMDNIDPASFATLFAGLDFARTGVIVISKSGGTAETLAQFLACRAQLAAAVGADRLATQVTAITEPRDNPLRRLAARDGIAVLDHDPGLGGRFSALSLVGLLPAMIAGRDPAAVRAGAAVVLEATLSARRPHDAAPAVGAAINVALHGHCGVSVAVLMPYSDRLQLFADWHRQLWAESLGKGGFGTTPVPALGAVDQHSQLQLYLDGPPDKLFTIITLERRGTGPALTGADDPALGYLAGRTMGDLMDAEQRATAETLVRRGRPLRLLRLARLDDHALGAMMMHFMLETIIAAHLLGVDPFDQPAVEDGKVLARQYLSEMP